MKLTGELKDKVEAVKTIEEKKNIIKEAGMELTDDELAAVAGGAGKNKQQFTCIRCGRSSSQIVCPKCEEDYKIL